MPTTALENPPAMSAKSAVPAAVNTPSERRLLSKAQVAARLGCSERSLERLVKQGRFPRARRFGRAVVWFEAAVEHCLGLAEAEQLQWRPEPVERMQPSESAPAPSAIPPAHELEEPAQPAAAKARKTASKAKKRDPLREVPGEPVFSLHCDDLSLLVNMPTLS